MLTKQDVRDTVDHRDISLEAFVVEKLSQGVVHK